MPRSRRDKLYLPPIPSPLNPDTCYDSPRTPIRQHSPGHRPRQTSPTLSYAQHILRAKAAEAWRAEHLRRICRDAHSPPRVKADAAPGDQDVIDGTCFTTTSTTASSPLIRAALDMHRGTAPNVHPQLNRSLPPAKPQATAVDLEYSLGLEPINPSPFAVLEEKPRFGLLQPFTVDFSHVMPPVSRRYLPREETRGTRSRYRAVVSRAFVLVALLCAAYCLAPGIQFRVEFKQGAVGVRADV